MAARAVLPVGPTALTGSLVTQYTAGTLASTSNSPVVIDTMIITNTTTGIVNFTLHRLPVSGSAAAGNMLFDAFPIAASDVTVFTQLGVVLDTGDFIQALGSGLNLYMTIKKTGIRV